MSYDLNQALRLARWYVEREIPPGHPDEALVNLSGALIGSVDLLGRQTVSDRDLEEQFESVLSLAEHLFQMIPQEVWREHGAEWMGQYEGDHHAEKVLEQLRAWRGSNPASEPEAS